jgi:cob(I)alamin adenosyltransferase
MKIYTKTGDDGTTGLFGGQRISKADPQIECYGSIDELNAVIGWAAVATPAELSAELRAVQSELFVIGSCLACPDPLKPPSHLPALEESSIARLESQMDAAQAQLPQLRNFILPGGSEGAARLHLARTICRRAERAVIAFSQTKLIPPMVVIYLNRLSDWLFVQARWTNQSAGVQDTPWPGATDKHPEL